MRAMIARHRFYIYSDGPPNEPPPLNEPPAILSVDLSLDSPQSIQGPCFMVSAIYKIPAGITTSLSKIFRFYQKIE